MREQYIPGSLRVLLSSFRDCFTARSFANFVLIISGWILCQGRHTISRVIQASGAILEGKHHSMLYRFFSRAKWNTDVVGKVLFRLLLPRLPALIEAIVDDTLCRRSGPHVFGAGMFHDSLRSTYGKGSMSGARHFFSFGHNWVVLAIRLPLPWDRERGIAIPVLWRLYRSRCRCPQEAYRKRTELALELIELLASWIPADRRLSVAADAEYACKTVVRALPPHVEFSGPVAKDAMLYEPAPSYRGLGRPRKKGCRLLSPRQWANSSIAKWRSVTISIYGKTVSVLVKSRTCLWYTVAGTRLIRIVLTRDPRGRIEDRTYFCTDSDASLEQVLVRFSHRWLIEVCFRDAKQHLGLEDPQNGWSKRRPGSRLQKKRPGPQPRGRRGERAILHTAPMVFVAYAITVMWYLESPQAHGDVHARRREAPWYQTKRRPSLLDMLVSLRRAIWAGRLSENPHDCKARRKVARRLVTPLLAA